MELLEGLQTRRSIRTYTDESVTREQLREIIRLGTMAPSGMNNQPWRFVTIQGKETLRKLSQLTKYSHVIGKAAACIAVFIDKTAMYHEVKDHQSMGACIQNLLLASHGMGLGGGMARRDPEKREGSPGAVRPVERHGVDGCCRARPSGGKGWTGGPPAGGRSPAEGTLVSEHRLEHGKYDMVAEQRHLPGPHPMG